MRLDNIENIVLKPAKLGRAVGAAFRDVWDRLGLVVAASLFWSVSVIIPLGLGLLIGSPITIALGAIIAWLVSTPILAGVHRMAYRIAAGEDASFREVLDGARELAKPSYGLSALNVLVVAVLGSDFIVYFGVIGGSHLSITLLVIGLMSLYMSSGWAVLAAQGPLGQRGGALQAFKRSWLLVLGSPGFTIGLFVVILGLSILCVGTAIGMLVLYAGFTAILHSRGLRELYVRYGVINESVEVTEQ